MTADLVLAALNMALEQRKPKAQVVHHSDQGRQYTAIEFGKRCKEMGVRPSMGTVGDAYDNAMAESFRQPYIEGWYNPRRRHRALGYRSPANFERRHHDGSRTSPSSVQHDLTAVGVCVACTTPPVDKSAPQLIEPAS